MICFNLHAMAFPILIAQQSIWESHFATPPSLHRSIESPICSFPCPCWSIDFSVAWNLLQSAPCLVADFRLEGCFFDFHYASFLSNQPIPHIIVIAAFTRKRRNESEKLSEILAEIDVLWWYLVCWSSLTIRSYFHLLPHEGQLVQLPYLLQAAT